MGKTVLIRNPKSGRGKWATSWAEIARSLGEIEVQETQAPGHATELARLAVEQGATLIIAAGGDGTVTQVANGLIGSDAAMAVLPMGTGNDLARTLGIGKSMDRAIAAIQAADSIQMDVGRWRTDLEEGHFLNIAGMGFDAAVADRINQGFRSLKGTTAYLAAVVSTLGKYRAKEVRLTLDGAVVEESIMLAAIANARSYGGGMIVAPMASVTDGMLDIVLVKEMGKLAFLKAFPSVFKGGHMGHPAVEHYRARSIRLEPRGESPFLIDGELTPCKWAEIEVLPKALKVVVP